MRRSLAFLMSARAGRAAALLAAASCSAPTAAELGPDALARAQVAFEINRDEEAAELAGALADDAELDLAERAEAAFLAGEAELARGEHERAFRRYRFLLEQAPFSEHFAVLEERLFSIGSAFFEDEEYDGWLFGSRSRGVEVMDTLQARFPRGERADDALKRVGDYFSSEDVRDYLQASRVYEQLVDEYPDSEWVEYALWRAGHCRMRLCYGPRYEREDLLQARELLERSLRLFPRGVAAARSREDLDRVLEQLASCEVLVADFYRARGVPAGERLRLANAALLYPGTEAGKQALRRLRGLGLDVSLLGADPTLNSVDNVKPGQRRFQPGRPSLRLVP